MNVTELLVFSQLMGYILYSAKEQVSEEQKGRLLSSVATAAVLQEPGVLGDHEPTLPLQRGGPVAPWGA